MISLTTLKNLHLFIIPIIQPNFYSNPLRKKKQTDYIIVRDYSAYLVHL